MYKFITIIQKKINSLTLTFRKSSATKFNADNLELAVIALPFNTFSVSTYIYFTSLTKTTHETDDIF